MEHTWLSEENSCGVFSMVLTICSLWEWKFDKCDGENRISSISIIDAKDANTGLWSDVRREWSESYAIHWNPSFLT